MLPTTEMTKYDVNSILVTKISFMNDIANLRVFVNEDLIMMRVGIGSDTKKGDSFIYLGIIGYRGSCFPKKVKALIKTAAVDSYQLQIIEAVNDWQKSILLDKVVNHFKGI